jgi:hypothetical protein
VRMADTQLSAKAGRIPVLREEFRCTQEEEVSGRWIVNQVKLRA